VSGGFGAYLVEQGLVLRQELERALKRQLENLVPLGRLAVEEGSTMVRIGSLIFGQRNY